MVGSRNSLTRTAFRSSKSTRNNSGNIGSHVSYVVHAEYNREGQKHIYDHGSRRKKKPKFSVLVKPAAIKPTSKITLSKLHNDLSFLEGLLIQKWRSWNLWQITRDLPSNTSVNWVSKTIKRMTRTKHSNAGKEVMELWLHTSRAVAY